MSLSSVGPWRGIPSPKAWGSGSDMKPTKNLSCGTLQHVVAGGPGHSQRWPCIDGLSVVTCSLNPQLSCFCAERGWDQDHSCSKYKGTAADKQPQPRFPSWLALTTAWAFSPGRATGSSEKCHLPPVSS